jgi:hypothetical protein
MILLATITELIKHTDMPILKALPAGQGCKEAGFGEYVFQNNWLRYQEAR